MLADGLAEDLLFVMASQFHGKIIATLPVAHEREQPEEVAKIGTVLSITFYCASIPLDAVMAYVLVTAIYRKFSATT